MKNKTITFLIILIFVAWDTSAQQVEPCKITLSNVSFSAGWYKPSMAYWNNTFLPNANTSDQFEGNMLYSGNITFDFPLNLGIRAGAWFWREEVNGENGGAFNTLRVDFTGINIGIFYKYRQGIGGIRPYIGIDQSFLMVQDRYNVSGTVSKESGNDMIYTPFVGIEHLFGQHFLLGIEYGYCLGRYLQDVETVSGIEAEKIKIDGSKIQLTVGYAFP
jgi:hypothetical protein